LDASGSFNPHPSVSVQHVLMRSIPAPSGSRHGFVPHIPTLPLVFGCPPVPALVPPSVDELVSSELQAPAAHMAVTAIANFNETANFPL
jgi:hypothetical protein